MNDDNDALSAELRCSAVVANGNEILLVRHVRGRRSYWVLPGGHPHRGETAPVAVERELMEETGLRVEAGKVLFVWETVFPNDSRHICEMVFWARLMEKAKEPKSSSELELPRFVPLEELVSLELYPPIAGYLKGASAGGFDRGAPHLGNMWREMDVEWMR